MNELFDHYKQLLHALLIPYLVFIFLLAYPINYSIDNPGGLTEVEQLIEVDYQTDKTSLGTISSTYIMDVTRPTFFQFIISYFSPYADINALSGSSLNYSNQEITKISYLDKATSIDAAIYIAYQEAQKTNPEITISVYQKTMVYGKATYLDSYDEIAFGDEFVSMLGDDSQLITDYTEISNVSTIGNTYLFTFINESGETYTVNLTKHEDTGLFGITLKNYYIVDEEATYPKYTINNSNIGGPSGGLLQTLSIYNQLVDEDITKGLKIAGTGTINYDGSVGYIGGVKQKIATAYLNHVDVFFMPYLDSSYYYDNYVEALRACEELGIDPTGWLVPIASFSDAITYLEGLGD